ncbi:alpha-N-acetylglucosaminidase TIM-barrel domain-containing protein [Sedimentisphaera cyanobacteriorum]|nr:alpha-N-acetylglucosaminidase TIM-barrel domain-containing protein [Sedimentisphaera cyanobacteriorum]
MQENVSAAEGLIERVLGKSDAALFEVEFISQQDGYDVFEIETIKNKIHLRGSNPVSVGRALKYYLNEYCNCSLSWRGDNLNLPSPLPMPESKARESTPFEYRYFFNNCVYGYSLAGWNWQQWERMIDIMALNGINLPLCLLGQEKVWQETYLELGFDKDDLKDFFAGPAWMPWQWMGNLDGWGGPLPQSVIDKQADLQKKILSRVRELGMKPVLSGFSGHIPAAVVSKYPDAEVHELEWQGFGPTYLLDWQEPLFKQIGSTFIKKQKEIYGTDHYYSIDPFNEMRPPSDEPDYIRNMGKTILNSMLEGDPQGTWVLMTWFCKSPQFDWNYWQTDITEIFFDSIPNDKLLALELHADSLQWTGWFRQNGWYGKPWIWCAIQNFGYTVDIYGGLPQITDNYKMMVESDNKGNLVGMGIAMEGLGYNPVVFELLFDMMWAEGVHDLDQWKEKYLLKRYGVVPESVRKAWEILYSVRYTRHERTGGTPLSYAPGLWDDAQVDVRLVNAWQLMLAGAEELADCQAYRYDLVNIGREVMGLYASHYSNAIKNEFYSKDVEGFEKASKDMLEFIDDFDSLLATNKHFLLGRWIKGFRSLGSTPEEKQLMEWNAKRQITDWGGNNGTYAVKEWSGIFSSYTKPLWEIYLNCLKKRMQGETVSDEQLEKNYAVFRKKWASSHSELSTKPVGCAVEVSRRLWQKYGIEIKENNGKGIIKTPSGIAVGKKAEAPSWENYRKPEYAVDGDIKRDNGWWAAAPAAITIDLEKVETLFGFQVYTYWGDSRYYQYEIETSLDGEKWVRVVDMLSNTRQAGRNGCLHKIKIAHPEGIKARYVRLNMVKNSANGSVHVSEFKVFNSEIGF